MSAYRPSFCRTNDADGKPIPLYDPLTGKYDIKFEAPASFYRTPTLVSVWATAPYLHNNALGIYTGDPSVAGRMAAYEDGMTKLLWPEKRLGIKSIKVTTEDSALPPDGDPATCRIRARLGCEPAAGT